MKFFYVKVQEKLGRPFLNIFSSSRDISVQRNAKVVHHNRPIVKTFVKMAKSVTVNRFGCQ